MLERRIKFHPHKHIDQAIKIAFSILLLCLLSPITIAKGTEIPITLQSMLVVLIPVIFGWRVGGFAVLGYLLLGGMGAPVFAEYSSGWSKFTGVSGGYLIGFLVAANIVGFFSMFRVQMETLVSLILMMGGQLIILGCGLFWMSGVVSDPINYALQLETFLPGVMIKSAIGMVIFIALNRTLRQPADREDSQPSG